jgi:site-specific DNA-methyltransferase (adenine-specific)
VTTTKRYATEDGAAVLRVGDCREELKRLADGSVDLVVTDPPYNIGLDYHEGYDDGQPEDAFLAMLEGAMGQCLRVLKPGGGLFLFMGANLQAEALVLLKRLGFAWRNTIVWHQTFGQAQKKKFTPSWVAIHHVVKPGADFTFNADAVRVPSARLLRYNDRRANPKGKVPDDVWVLDPDRLRELLDPAGDVWLQSRVCGTFGERTGHVTQLPLPLVERIVRVASNPGELVLDPFAGSGTVLAAALRLGRHAYGVELSPETAALAWDRVTSRG